MASSDHEGVLDAFAEVFASMAASAPAALEPSRSEFDPAAADIRADDGADQDQQDRADKTDEESGDSSGIQAHSLVDGIHSESSTDLESIQLATAIDQDDQGFTDQRPELSTTLSDQTIIAPGPVNNESSQDHATLPRDIREAKKSAGNDGPRLDSQRPTDTAGVELAKSGSSPSNPAAAVPPEANSDVTGVGIGGETADESGDRSRHRARHDRSERQHPLEEVAAKQGAAKPHAQLPSEHASNVPAESLSESVAERPTAPPSDATKAAAAAITGVSPAGSAAVPKSSPSHTSLAGRSAENGFATALDSTAAPKSESKSDAKGATREGVSEAVNRAKLIQRVSKAFQHLGPDGGVVRLRLAPAELGTVRIEMRIDGRKMEARVVAETEAASSALREHLPDLRARLESFGMQVERIDIETESSETNPDGRFSGNEEGDRRSDQQGPRSRSFRPRNDESVSRGVSSAPPLVLAQTATTLPGIGVDLRL
jgi:flagellar hook-length control protein FliK